MPVGNAVQGISVSIFRISCDLQMLQERCPPEAPQQQPESRAKLIFVNSTRQYAYLYWYTAGSAEQHHRTIAPGAREQVGSYAFHRWKIRDASGEQWRTKRTLRLTAPTFTVWR